jgi:hypothetical protein
MLPVGIDSLKSTIGRRGGIARTNRFAVYMSHPSGSQGLLNDDWSGIASNLISSFIGGGSRKVDPWMFFNDPRDMFLLCDSIQLPGRRISTTERGVTHHRTKKPYTYLNEEVTFSFILTNDYHVKKYFDSWQNSIVSGDDLGIAYKKAYTTDIVIQQLTSGNDIIPAYGVKLLNAFPISVSAIELSNQTMNEYVRVTVTVAYDDWQDENLLETAGSLWDMGKKLLGATGSQFTNIGNTLGKFF